MIEFTEANLQRWFQPGYAWTLQEAHDVKHVAGKRKNEINLALLHCEAGSAEHAQLLEERTRLDLLISCVMVYWNSEAGKEARRVKHEAFLASHKPTEDHISIRQANLLLNQEKLRHMQDAQELKRQRLQLQQEAIQRREEIRAEKQMTRTVQDVEKHVKDVVRRSEAIEAHARKTIQQLQSRIEQQAEKIRQLQSQLSAVPTALNTDQRLMRLIAAAQGTLTTYRYIYADHAPGCACTLCLLDKAIR